MAVRLVNLFPVFLSLQNIKQCVLTAVCLILYLYCLQVLPEKFRIWAHVSMPSPQSALFRKGCSNLGRSSHLHRLQHYFLYAPGVWLGKLLSFACTLTFRRCRLNELSLQMLLKCLIENFIMIIAIVFLPVVDFCFGWHFVSFIRFFLIWTFLKLYININHRKI